MMNLVRRRNDKMKKIIGLLFILLSLGLSVTAYAWDVSSVTWQDANNAVLIWDKTDNCSYKIYRSSSKDGSYEQIGETKLGSFRDDEAKYPDTYYYKVEKIDSATKKSELSEPIASGTNQQNISSVSVIMYHNFVSEEDIASGVEFEEYSLKPEDFEKDLVWLRDNGYVTITSKDLIGYLEGKKSLPAKAVIISIDDGSYGVYKNAWPLLKKYNMKADFNVIGTQIDETWEKLSGGGTRLGDAAPYCTWEELTEMSESGEINICSHTYGMHVYDKENRIGMSMMGNETDEEFAKAVKRDYELSVSCIEGWTGKTPETVAYPYSKRSSVSDRIVLSNTGYKILMAGDGARGTVGNYFVDGCDFENQLTLMSRPCRMDGTPIEYYLNRIYEEDGKNGVNIFKEPLSLSNSVNIAADYKIFDDVKGNAWYAGSVYYAYANKLMKGVSYKEFAPEENISRAMAVTLLHRLADVPKVNSNASFSDIKNTDWYFDAVLWANENDILKGFDDKTFRPDDSLSRENLAQAMYRCAQYMKADTSKRAEINSFVDAEKISPQNIEAVKWCVANGILRGNADGSFNPKGNVTRAQMATILQNWIREFAVNQ